MRFSEALTTRNLSISFSNLIAFLGRIKGHSFSILSLWALIGFNGLFLAQINTLCPTSLLNLFPAAPFCIPWLYALSTGKPTTAYLAIGPFHGGISAKQTFRNSQLLVRSKFHDPSSSSYLKKSDAFSEGVMSKLFLARGLWLGMVCEVTPRF